MSDLMLENPINENIVSSENTVSDVVNESGLSTYIIFSLIAAGCYGLYYYYYGRVISELKFKIGKFEIVVNYICREFYGITIGEYKKFDDIIMGEYWTFNKLYNFEIESKDLYDLMSTGKSDEAIEFSRNLINVNVSNAMKKLIDVFDGGYLEYSDRRIEFSSDNTIYIDFDDESKKILKYSLMNIVNQVNEFFEVYENLDGIWNEGCKSIYKKTRQKMESFVKVGKFGNNIKSYTFKECIYLTYQLNNDKYIHCFDKISMDENSKHSLSSSMNENSKESMGQYNSNDDSIKNAVSDFCISKYNEILNFIKDNKNIDLNRVISDYNLSIDMSYLIGDSNSKNHSIKSNFYFNDFKFDVKKFFDDIRKMIEYFDIFKDHNLLNQQTVDKLNDLSRMCDEYDDHMNELEYKDQKVCLYEYKLGDVTKCEIYVLGKSGDTNYRTVISRGKYSSVDDFKKNSGNELFTFIAGYFCESVLLFECNEILKKCDITGLYDNQSILQRVLKKLAEERTRKGSEVIFVVESILSSIGLSKLFVGVISLINPISLYDIKCKVIYKNPSIEIIGNNYTDICNTLSDVLEEAFNKYEESLKNTKSESPDASFIHRLSDKYDDMLDEWIEDIDYDGLPLVVDDISSINSDDVDSVDYDSYYDE
jgi:hypothetical protein